MADEVLKLIVTADTSKAKAEIKGFESELNKVSASGKKAADSFKLPPIGNIFGKEINEMSAQLSTLRTSLGGVTEATVAGGEAAQTAAASTSLLGSTMAELGGPVGIVTGVIIANATALGIFAGEAIKAGLAYDTTMKKIAGATGETGESLQNLGRDVLSVFSSVPQSGEEVAAVMTKLHQRFDATGASLQETTRDILAFARVTGTPVQAALDGTLAVLSSWDLKISDAPRLLNLMTVAFQKSGIPIQQLTGYLENNDAILKQFGFNLETSIALLANLERRGVSIPRVLSGLARAAPTFANAGIEPQTGFSQAVDLIKNSSNEDALKVSKAVFGKGVVAVEMADAIRSGAFDIGEMNAALEISDGVLQKAASSSMTLTEQLKLMKNAAESLLTPLGSALVETIEKYLLPAFTVLAFKLSETVYWMEYLAGINPTLSNLDIAKATRTGPKGAAPALSVAQITELSGKGPTKANTAVPTVSNFLSQLKKTGTGGGKETDLLSERFLKPLMMQPEKAEGFDRTFSGQFKAWEEEMERQQKAATEISKMQAEIRVASAATEKERTIALYEEDAKAFEQSELFKNATLVQQLELRGLFEERYQAQRDAARRARAEGLQDDISVLAAEVGAGGTGTAARFRGEQANLAVKQQIELRKASERGADLAETTLIQQRQGLEVIQLQQRQYDTMFSQVKTQAEGVFDAMFSRGKKGFAGLLDYIKATFVTKLKDLFGDLVATLFVGKRPGLAGAGAGGGLFGGLFSSIGGLFGGGGGIFGGQGGPGGVFGGGAGPGGIFSLAGGGGGIRSLLGLGGASASTAGELALPTSIFRPETLGGAGAAGGGGSFFGLSGAQLGAFFTNPITIAAGIGIAATIAFLKLRKTREDKFRAEILRDFALNVPDKNVLKQIKRAGEAVFGKDADKKRFETLRLDQVQGLLLNYATASGQDPSRLPIYQKFYGGLGSASRSISFDPSRGVPAFAMGTPYVPQTGLAIVHKGEAIIPAAQNRGGGGVVINAPLTIHMNDGDDPRKIERVFDKHRRELMKAFDKGVNGDFRRSSILSGLIGT